MSYCLLCGKQINVFRYIMLILKESEVYFLDRDNSVFVTDKIVFPRRKNPEEHIFDTVVDGVRFLPGL